MKAHLLYWLSKLQHLLGRRLAIKCSLSDPCQKHYQKDHHYQ
jgi:hypothetical protein